MHLYLQYLSIMFGIRKDLPSPTLLSSPPGTTTSSRWDKTILLAGGEGRERVGWEERERVKEKYGAIIVPTHF